MVHDLFWAVKEGTLTDVRNTCQTATDVNAVDIEGCTPLYYAVDQGDLEKVKCLLSVGANAVAIAPERMRRYAILRAAELGHLAIVEAILDAGYHPDIVAEEGDPTALMYAALKNHVDVIQLLLSRDANPNYKSVDRLRPIDYTTGLTCLEAYEILLPLTDRWYRKTAKKNLELWQGINERRAAENTPEKKAERERKYQEFVEKQEKEGTLIDQLIAGKIKITDIKPYSMDDLD